ncbi:hypothetical protein BB559_001835 [Furculomyces boomerangus]|uniref:DNA mismatch repair protein S5 domain-containing protein n=2 Tax=Harpellales TaxID=61421 RepID=A0A2T9Z084_9FUNG|nr:hypothetical protein BB559_001835 [Furculomyces boomerangus]
MSCRKVGGKSLGADLQTTQGLSKIEVIQQVYGKSVSSNLHEFKRDLNETQLAVNISGYATSGDFDNRKTTLLLFINNRLVENNAIKTSIEQLYTIFPKSPKPFIYLNLYIRPQYVDVNVHPTKKEVHFLHQDQIINEIVNSLQDILMSENQSQTLPLQDNGRYRKSSDTDFLEPSGRINVFSNNYKSRKETGSGTDYENRTYSRKVPEHKMVRMDSKNLSLRSFMFNDSSDLMSSPGPKVPSDVFGSPLGFKESTPTRRKFTANKPELSSPTLTNNSNGVKNSLLGYINQKDTYDNVSQGLDSISNKDGKDLLKEAMEDVCDNGVENYNLLKEDNNNLGYSVSPSNQNQQSMQTDTISYGLDPSSVYHKDSGASQNMLTTNEIVGLSNEAGLEEALDENKKRLKVEVKLTSVLSLRKEWTESAHVDLTRIIRGHTFVGFVDSHRALIQHDTCLYMINYNRVSEALFYQLILVDFCNFGTIEITPSPKIYDLVMIALMDEIESDKELRKKSHLSIDEEEQLLPAEILESPETVARAISELFQSRREMLEEYYCIKVTSDGSLETIPMIIRDYVPNLHKLPLFLLRAGTDVDWEDEVNFFKMFSSELAYFYSCEPPSETEDDALSQIDETSKEKTSSQTIKSLESENSYSSYETQMEVSPKDKSKTTDTSFAFCEENVRELALKRGYSNMVSRDTLNYQKMVEYRVFPTLKAGFCAPSSLVDDNCIEQIASLPDLYKIFERC